MPEIPITPDLVQGAVSLEDSGDGLKPWRIPHAERRLFPPDPGLAGRASSPSGVRLRLRTDSPSLALHVFLEESDGGPQTFDAVIDGEIAASVNVEGEGARTVTFTRAGSGQPEWEIWLPVWPALRLRGLEIEERCRLEPLADERPRWITYGSSITMCRRASSPALTWPALAARLCGLHLTSLGFGGQCHVDAMVGRLIRELPADVITLKLGINVQGSASLGWRGYLAAVIALVCLIREKHPQTPIGLITPIVSPPRESARNPVGLSLEDYRAANREAFERLCACGDERLLLFEGPELLGHDEAHLLPDALHPNGEGYQLIGRRVAEHVLPRLLAL
jgi:hypothetical protein